MHTCADATQKTSHQNEFDRPGHLAEAQEECAGHHQHVAAQKAVLPVHEKGAKMLRCLEEDGDFWPWEAQQQPSLPSEKEGPATSHPIVIRQGIGWGFWCVCVRELERLAKGTAWSTLLGMGLLRQTGNLV